MKKILLRLTIFMFSFSVILFFLYFLFKPIYNAESIIFTFSITPFDIAKVYPKIWEFIKKIYFLLFFISYAIIFNYLYSTFQKYINFNKTSKVKKEKIATKSDNTALKLLIGRNSNRRKSLYGRKWTISKYAYYWNNRNTEKRLQQCTLLLAN